MAYSAKAVANYILDLGEKASVPISPMKLQKLLYYAQGWCLAIADEPLIDEQIEAWKWGPVIRSIYREFKEFGNAPITRRARMYRIHRDGELLKITHRCPTIDDDKSDPIKLQFVRHLLERVWEVYSKYTPIQLSNMTHEKGAPWDKIVSKYQGDPPKGTDIPQSLLKRHFNELAKQR